MFQPEKILLIDDEAGLLELLTITLKKERYHNITCAKTGTAVRFCNANAWRKG